MGAPLHGGGFAAEADIWQKMTNSIPNQVFSDTAESSAKRLKLDNERKLRDEVK